MSNSIHTTDRDTKRSRHRSNTDLTNEHPRPTSNTGQTNDTYLVTKRSRPTSNAGQTTDTCPGSKRSRSEEPTKWIFPVNPVYFYWEKEPMRQAMGRAYRTTSHHNLLHS